MTAELGAQWRPGDPCFKCGTNTRWHPITGRDWGICPRCFLAFKHSDEADPNAMPAVMPKPIAGRSWTVPATIRPTTPPDAATGPDGDEA